MRRLYAIVCLSLLVIAIVTGCSGKVDGVPEPMPGVYYWRTVYKLNEGERDWLSKEKIGKMYLRLFDVTMSNDEPKPQATIRFDDALPDGVKIIPTIFIDEQVLREYDDVSLLASLLSERIAKMSKTHRFEYEEIQIDCDWTHGTQDLYFELLSCMKENIGQTRLSATIRLHQLGMQPPPVEYGVLMLYNTGDFRRADNKYCHNPILDSRDVETYLPYLNKYPLPLCAAYPNFSWQLLFADDEFKGILYGEDLSDTTLYHKVSDDEYRVVNTRVINMQLGVSHLRLFPGERVRVWHSEPKEIERVRDMVEANRPGINDQVIVYHLDEGNF